MKKFGKLAVLAAMVLALACFISCGNLHGGGDGKKVTIPFEGDGPLTQDIVKKYSDWKETVTVIISEEYTSIGSAAFASYYKLTSVTIPSSVTSIGNNAFDGCKSLTSVTIPSDVTEIGHMTFNICESLTSVTIPSSVTSIGNEAFLGCKSLTSVTFESTDNWKTGYDYKTEADVSDAASNASKLKGVEKDLGSSSYFVPNDYFCSYGLSKESK